MHASRVAENAASLGVLAAMVLLALFEVGGRTLLGRSIPGSIVLVQHLTLWVALLGAALAARSDRLLSLSTAQFLPDRWRDPARVFSSAVAVAVTAGLAIASVDLVRVERGSGDIVAWGIPSAWVLSILPIGFAVITGRLAWHAAKNPRGRIIALAGLGLTLLVAALPNRTVDVWLTPGLVVLGAATALGMPIFAAMGGAALLLFLGDGTPANAVPGEAYRLTTSPMLPAIPLFALGGYILAEGGASRRLMRLLTAIFGWMPGGLAIVTTGILAFFTPLTGASGVTILSMGGLLLPVMTEARYPERTSIGLVTVSGSIGLLFFPSLPVFLYAFYAGVPVERLFVGALIPGILLVVVVAAWAAARGALSGAVRTPFDARTARQAIWQSKWELFLPVLVLGLVIAGWATLLEAAAISVLYVVMTECGVHRTLNPLTDLPRITIECATLLGGFLIVLSVALGLTNYLVLAEVPTHALEWAQARIHSPLLFLLALNLFLIVVGGLMDIYSAIVVVVPLILPMAASYGVDPIHLAVIFLANMELGYLTPPMGENLFLAAYRFEQPLTRIYRSTIPYTLMLAIAVLVITCAPTLTSWLVTVFEHAGYLLPLDRSSPVL